MSDNDTAEFAPITLLAGGDPTDGRFEWVHADCGTIYADSEDDAIAHAKTRLDAHDPTNAAFSCVHVKRVAFNTTPKDWKPS